MPKIAKPLVASNISRLKPRPVDYDQADGNGLYIRIRSTGSKTWLFRYVNHASKRQNITLGAWPALTLSDARKKAAECHELLAADTDPKHHQMAERARLRDTFMEVAQDWLSVKRPKVSNEYANDIWRRIEIHLLPEIGDIPISKITAPDVISILKPIEANGAHETVKRICRTINEIMTFASNTGRIEFNRLAGIGAAFIAPAGNHYPTITAAEFPAFMQKLYKANIRTTTRNLIHFQLHTMVRPGEAAGAMWCEIDTPKKLWTIPAERMKGRTGKRRDHVVPLADAVIEILIDQQAISHNSEYVFPGDRDRHKPANESSVNMAIRRMGFGGRLVAHGFRALASTVLNDNEFDGDIIETALAHLVGDSTRKAYNRAKYLERRNPMMAWWSNYIIEAQQAQPAKSKRGLKLAGIGK